MTSPFSCLVNVEQIRSSGSQTLSLDYENVIRRASKDGWKRLKVLMRELDLSPSHPVRSFLWPLLISVKFGVQLPQMDDTAAPNSSPSREVGVSDLAGYELSDQMLIPIYHLNDDGKTWLRNILHHIAIDHPEFVYVPQLWPILALLLHYHPPEMVKFCTDVLLRKSSMIVQTKHDWILQSLSLEHLGRAGFASKDISQSLKALRSTTVTVRPHADDPRIQVARWNTALWNLPFEHLVRVMDCFLLEGNKVLYRCGLRLWKASTREQPSSGVNGSFQNQLAVNLVSYAPRISLSPTRLIHKMFSIRKLSRKNVRKAIENVERSEDFSTELSAFEQILLNTCTKGGQSTYASYLVGRHGINDTTSSYVHPSECINADELADLVRSITDNQLSNLCKPVLLFSTNRDGTSLRTLYEKAALSDRPSTLLLVRTLSGQHVIGAFCTDRWEPFLKPHYFGRGLSFLFRIRPSPLVLYRWIGLTDGQCLQNQSFQYSTMKDLHVGGPGASGQQGLSLDEYLSTGTTGRSPVFNNERLIIGDEDILGKFGSNDEACSFHIGLVELLGFEDLSD